MGSDSIDNRVVRRESKVPPVKFVAVDQDRPVYDYDALAASSVTRVLATSAVRRNMPYPVAAMALARLKVDLNAQAGTRIR